MNLPRPAVLIGEVLPPESELDGDGFAVGARPLCPFCSKPWSSQMMRMFDRASVSQGYYGDVDGVELTIDITCDGCERLVYRKEVEVSPWGGDHWQK